MSDNSIPEWADAMEHRIISEVAKALGNTTTNLRSEIANLRADMNQRFDQIHDDITVSMARADRAHHRVDQEHDEVVALRVEIQKVWLRLRAVEKRIMPGDHDGPAE
jgi:uncharacterized coiled-coil DUF342 family protein